MDEARQQSCEQQQQPNRVRFACDETESGESRSPSLGPLLALDIPTTSDTTKPQGPEKAVEHSLQMVPYVPRGSGQGSSATVKNRGKRPLFTLSKLLRAPSVPRHVLGSGAGLSRGGLQCGGLEMGLGPVSPQVSFLLNGSPEVLSHFSCICVSRPGARCQPETAVS